MKLAAICCTYKRLDELATVTSAFFVRPIRSKRGDFAQGRELILI